MDDSRAKEYARHKYILFFADIVFTIIVLLVYQSFLSETFKHLAFSFHFNLYVAITSYLVFFSLFLFLAGFPLHFYSSYILEHKFKLSNQRFLDWIKDDIKGNLITLIFFLLIVHGFYLLLRKSGPLWWIWAALSWILFNIMFAKVLPTFIIPIFYKYSDIENKNLKERIKTLASKASVKLLDVFQIDFSKKTKKANAALVGIGNSRRVILADNLINEFSGDEIEIVCAHEFAHHKLFHLWKEIVFFGSTSVIGFYFFDLIFHKLASLLSSASVYDIKIFPAVLLVLFVFSMLIKPVHNVYSRLLEKEADRFAINLSSGPEAFISVMKKLSKMNLSDEDPPKIIKYLLYDHPPISERIKMAKGLRQ